MHTGTHTHTYFYALNTDSMLTKIYVCDVRRSVSLTSHLNELCAMWVNLFQKTTQAHKYSFPFPTSKRSRRKPEKPA